MATPSSETLSHSLTTAAAQLARAESLPPFAVTIEVLHNPQAAQPWRVLETWVCDAEPTPRIRQAWCFSCPRRCLAYLQERTRWREADLSLLAQAFFTGLPACAVGARGKEQVAQALAALEAQRLALARQALTVRPDGRVPLSVGSGGRLLP